MLMISFRSVVVAAGLVGYGAFIASAEPFAWESSPDITALAAACAPVKGKPSSSIPLLMDALVPLEEVTSVLQPMDLIRWHEYYYMRNGEYLAHLEATGIYRWYVAQGTQALLTAEDGEVVQRDLLTLTVTGHIGVYERVLGFCATAFPDLVLIGAVPEGRAGTSTLLCVHNLRTGKTIQTAMEFLGTTINETRDVLASEGSQFRISLESPDKWEETPSDANAETWQSLESADESQVPKALQFPAYRSAESQWTREAFPEKPAVQQIIYQETLLGALRDMATADPAALPPGNAPGCEVLEIDYDRRPGLEVSERRKDLDENTRAYFENSLEHASSWLLVTPATGDYFLLSRISGGTSTDYMLRRVTEGKPVLAWDANLPGDSGGFIGTSPDGRYFIFSAIRLDGKPWMIVLRAEDLRAFILQENPTGWGPTASQVAFEPKGKRVAAATPDGSIWIYNIDQAKGELTLGDRIQALPLVLAGGDADTVPETKRIGHLTWIDPYTLLFDVGGEYAQALSLSTRLPLWTYTSEALTGAVAVPDTGVVVLWSTSQALVLEGQSGLPLGAPRTISLNNPKDDDTPTFAAERTPEGQLRIRAGKESWLRKLPKVETLSYEAAQALLAHRAGLQVLSGTVMKRMRLPEEMAVKK